MTLATYIHLRKVVVESQRKKEKQAAMLKLLASLYPQLEAQRSRAQGELAC